MCLHPIYLKIQTPGCSNSLESENDHGCPIQEASWEMITAPAEPFSPMSIAFCIVKIFFFQSDFEDEDDKSSFVASEKPTSNEPCSFIKTEKYLRDS